MPEPNNEMSNIVRFTDNTKAARALKNAFTNDDLTRDGDTSNIRQSNPLYMRFIVKQFSNKFRKSGSSLVEVRVQLFAFC